MQVDTAHLPARLGLMLRTSLYPSCLMKLSHNKNNDLAFSVNIGEMLVVCSVMKLSDDPCHVSRSHEASVRRCLGNVGNSRKTSCLWLNSRPHRADDTLPVKT